jgi:hypothetical protein
MSGYTLKLDLTEYEHGVLVLLLRTDLERSEREGTTGSPWHAAVSKISEVTGTLPRGAATTPGTLTADEQFFYEHAGYGFDRATETSEQGHVRTARLLAAAEQALKAGPYFVDHTPDDEPWDGVVPYDGPLWVVTLYSVSGATESEVIGSLSSVACEADDPYMRVVAAELAREYIPNVA